MAKSSWLQEVEDDATRITEKRFRDQEEERQYKESKKVQTKKEVRVVEPEVVEQDEPSAPELPKEKKGK